MQTMVAVKRDGQWRSAASSSSRLWKIEQQSFLDDYELLSTAPNTKSLTGSRRTNRSARPRKFRS
jgi:hypothetical protein